MLNFRIERNGIPIYVRIRDQVLRAIGSGVPHPREQSSIMCQLTVDLNVDLNMVRRVYDELEDTGSIVIGSAIGTSVAATPHRST